jgi:hypothetical protein
MVRIHRDDRVHEHADVAAVAHRAEAALAASMSGEVEFRCIGHRQHMPSSRTSSGQPPDMSQHFVAGDRLVFEKVGEPTRPGAILRQHAQAHGSLLLHRGQ